MDKQTAVGLDKYYTKPEIAAHCYKALVDLLKNKNKHWFLEPSAGSGVFLPLNKKFIGVDLEPENDTILKRDFLKDDLTCLLKGKSIVVIGNPPFGYKGNLAIEFINKAFQYGEIVGFILPIQFRKWSTQSKINPTAKLVLDMDLPENSFELVGKDYSLRCCFQVWTISETAEADLRITKKPPTTHEDFEMYQYNRTDEAEKFFDYDWDFAVPRQGYLDYTKKMFKASDCDRKQQWIFFKAKSPDVLKRLLGLDFDKLSKKNSNIPGFGKADVIKEYEQRHT